jgi:glycosyltransferase involved in cell wall biosynthesis
VTGEGRTSGGADLIFVSLETWDEIWRRNQFVCAELARRHQGRRILFVEPPRDVSAALRRREASMLAGGGTRTLADFPNITVTRPMKLLPNSVGAMRRANELAFRRHVRRAARGAGIREPLLWLNAHSAVHMVGRAGERGGGVIYDVTDDWTTLTQSPRAQALIVRQDAELCRRARAVIVCSKRLAEMKRSLARDVHLIPNGVDADHYAQVLESKGPLPDETRTWTRPVLGYTGTVHPDRVDVELVRGVAQGLSKGSVVLLGPNHLPASDLERLALPNVFMPGPVPYARVPQYMRAFDVCITPHRATAFTESLNPIKLWEYFAGGKPIVSTDVAGFREYPQLVHVAGGPSADEFLAMVREALAEGPERAEARRSEARRHSWQSRVDEIEAVLDRCAGVRGAEATDAAA